jgi:MSHA pilin protein MshD
MFIKRQAGLTLIELVIFMVIMGVAAAGILGVLNMGASTSADPVRRKQALMIAEAFMEEVLLARFTYCDANDPNVETVAAQNACTTQLTISRPAGAHPYATVANYGSAAGTATSSFAVNGVDVDINGRALGLNAGLATMGNVSLAGITTTVTLNYLAANPDPALNQGLGPQDARNITSVDTDIRALRITIRTTYGTGNNDFVQLDAYRTRHAPTPVQ